MATITRKKATEGAIIEIVRFGLGQVLRFVSTIILTRLLFPEAFGLAAFVSIFLLGLTMLSDAGIAQSIVQNKRGDDLRFLNTAWTLNVVRGVLLWIVACMGAWPMAIVYDEPQLMWLIPVGSLAVLIQGFASTSLTTLRREVSLKRVATVELSSHFVSLVVTIGWAYVSPTVWAIVAGNLVAALFRTAVSHWITVGYRNAFAWHRDDVASIYAFGKWIFLSSALTFVSLQADRILLGQLAGMATLGIYSLAHILSTATGTLAGRISAGVLYPVLSNIAREKPQALRSAYYRARLRTDAIGLLPLGVLFTTSQLVIDILYDQRYQAAGWMLQILTLRVALSVTLETMKNCLLALGHSHYGLHQSAARTIGVLIGIPIGWHFFGIEGLIWGAALAELVVAPFLLIAMQRHALLLLRREMLAIAIFVIGALLGMVVEDVVRLLLDTWNIQI